MCVHMLLNFKVGRFLQRAAERPLFPHYYGIKRVCI